MKRIIRIFPALIVTALLLGGCKSFKVLYNWHADDREGIEGKKTLVVARAETPEVRKAFEKEVTAVLRAEGLDATSSYVAFPDFDPAKKVDKKEDGEIRDILQNNGYHAVVLTVLKDFYEDTREVGDSNYYASVNYGYIDRPTYLGWGFYTYFYHPLSYSTEDVLVEKNEIDVITSKNYVLDSMAFNLDLPEDQQMIALFRASIENPDGASATAKSYAKAIYKTIRE